MSVAQVNSYFDKEAPLIVLKSLFDKYDLDLNGKLDSEEFKILLKDDLGLSLEQYEAYKYLLDQDGDGLISFDEFVIWMKSGDKFKAVSDKARYHYLKKAVDMFKQYDLDRDGSIDSKEFDLLYYDIVPNKEKHTNVLRRKSMFEVDLDHDGRVSFQEFMRWLHWVPLEDLFLKHP
ncbi:uncharacterized protein [Clytia hemisphaerica]|uniref:EF-hand domain-containing protein n=1 Tax=Clytia hemisphaerica TaxID=252671 RepID=A0A7M5XH23_9CNID